MFYEINIALNGVHFFATAERSITNGNELKEVYSVLKEKFPESEGYEITISHCYKYYEKVDPTGI